MWPWGSARRSALAGFGAAAALRACCRDTRVGWGGLGSAQLMLELTCVIGLPVRHCVGSVRACRSACRIHSCCQQRLACTDRLARNSACKSGVLLHCFFVHLGQQGSTCTLCIARLAMWRVPCVCRCTQWTTLQVVVAWRLLCICTGFWSLFEEPA